MTALHNGKIRLAGKGYSDIGSILAFRYFDR